jgi:inner membrane protein
LEPLTHFLTGACLGRAGFNRKTALATLTMTLAAEAPDLDIATIVKGRVFYFAHHRGFTHSFLGLFLVSAAVVGLVFGFWRIRGRKITSAESPPRWGLLFLLAYLAGLSHILLDFTNSYGVRPFWPFSERWYSWDIEFIVEPVLLVLLIGALILPKLFSLINDEIGARRKGLPGRFAASAALLTVVLFWGLRDYEHRHAVNALEARTYQGLDAIRASAYPDWLNPFRWVGVVETENFIATMEVNSITPDVDPQGQMRIHYKPPETPVTIAAKKSYLGRVYLDWAQYPITETETLESPPGYLVRFRDLRYDYPAMRSRSTLSATVELDSNLRVLRETSGSPRSPDTGKP